MLRIFLLFYSQFGIIFEAVFSDQIDPPFDYLPLYI